MPGVNEPVHRDEREQLDVTARELKRLGAHLRGITGGLGVGLVLEQVAEPHLLPRTGGSPTMRRDAHAAAPTRSTVEASAAGASVLDELMTAEQMAEILQIRVSTIEDYAGRRGAPQPQGRARSSVLALPCGACDREPGGSAAYSVLGNGPTVTVDLTTMASSTQTASDLAALIGRRISVAGHFVGFVTLDGVDDLGHAVSLRIRTADGVLQETVLELAELESGTVAPAEEGAGLVEGGQLFDLIESRRIELAYAHDPNLAVSLSGVRGLPHQIIAVYKHMLPQPRLRFGLPTTRVPARRSWRGFCSRSVGPSAQALGRHA